MTRWTTDQTAHRQWRRVLVAPLLWALCNSALGATEPAKAQLPLQELRTFTSVLEHIRRNYVEEIDDKTLLENAIRGMMAGLDPHSSYLDASAYDDLQVNTTGEFGGLGLEVGMENGFLRVISPIDDTPAKRAGIESGDIIIKLDKKTVKGMSLGDTIKKMRGPSGSKITLTIVREGRSRPFDVILSRDIIKVRSVKSQVLEPGYGYLRIAQFQAETGDEAAQAITQLSQQNPRLKGLILDLRDNPGGILQASVQVVDNLLERGLIVYTQGRVANSRAEFHAKPGDLSNGARLVVLINSGSASASEIVAGALQDHKRAIIMGTESFGKGSVQTVMPISRDQAIKLTTALYYTPNGRSIQATGIAPDIVVDRAKVERIARRGKVSEADLSGHLANGNQRDDKDATGSGKGTTRNLQMEDNQLYEALTLLKGLNILSMNNLAPELPATGLPATGLPATKLSATGRPTTAVR